MLIKYSGLKAAPEYGLIRRAAHAMMPAGRRAALLEIVYTYKGLAQDFIEKNIEGRRYMAGKVFRPGAGVTLCRQEEASIIIPDGLFLFLTFYRCF